MASGKEFLIESTFYGKTCVKRSENSGEADLNHRPRDFRCNYSLPLCQLSYHRLMSSEAL